MSKHAVDSTRKKREMNEQNSMNGSKVKSDGGLRLYDLRVTCLQSDEARCENFPERY